MFRRLYNRFALSASPASASPAPKWEDTIPFVIPITSAHVIKCYDGDTITIAFKMFDTMYRTSVRINGIDCAEIKGKSPQEKQCALRAKHRVEELVLNKVVQLKNCKTEKYGRLLADVFFLHDGILVSLAQVLLDENLAVVYDGGTKQPFSL